MDALPSERRLQARALELSLEPLASVEVWWRLRVEWPLASGQQLDDAIAVAEKIKHRAFELTEPCWPPGRVADGEFKAMTNAVIDQLSREYPDLELRALERATGKAHYWHFRD